MSQQKNTRILNLIAALADAANKLDETLTVINGRLQIGDGFLAEFRNADGMSVIVTIERDSLVRINECESSRAVIARVETYDVERATAAVRRWADGMRYGYSNKRLMEAFGSVEATVVTPPAPEPIDDNQPSEDVPF